MPVLKWLPDRYRDEYLERYDSNILTPEHDFGKDTKIEEKMEQSAPIELHLDLNEKINDLNLGSPSKSATDFHITVHPPTSKMDSDISTKFDVNPRDDNFFAKNYNLTSLSSNSPKFESVGDSFSHIILNNSESTFYNYDDEDQAPYNFDQSIHNSLELNSNSQSADDFKSKSLTSLSSKNSFLDSNFNQKLSIDNSSSHNHTFFENNNSALLNKSKSTNSSNINSFNADVIVDKEINEKASSLKKSSEFTIKDRRKTVSLVFPKQDEGVSNISQELLNTLSQASQSRVASLPHVNDYFIKNKNVDRSATMLVDFLGDATSLLPSTRDKFESKEKAVFSTFQIKTPLLNSHNPSFQNLNLNAQPDNISHKTLHSNSFSFNLNSPELLSNLTSPSKETFDKVNNSANFVKSTMSFREPISKESVSSNPSGFSEVSQNEVESFKNNNNNSPLKKKSDKNTLTMHSKLLELALNPVGRTSNRIFISTETPSNNIEESTNTSDQIINVTMQKCADKFLKELYLSKFFKVWIYCTV